MGRFLRRALVFACAVVVLAACGGLAGVPGGGSVVEGQVRIAGGELAPSSVAAIEVAVAGTSIATVVGADGSFVLEGVPAGDVDLVFRGAWGASQVRIEGIARGQRVRLAVAVDGDGAAIEAVTRSSDDLVLDLQPDRWQLSWLDEGGDQPVVAMITGDATFLDRLDGDCFQLVGDLYGTAPLLPVEVLTGTTSVALRFAGADALGLLAAPFVGSQHEVEIGFCLTPADDALDGSAAPEAETYFLAATVTIADDDVLAPDAPLFVASFDPEAIGPAPLATDTARLVVRGAEIDLDRVTGGRLWLADTSGEAGSAPAGPELVEAVAETLPPGLEVAFVWQLVGDDAPYLEAVVAQAELVALVGGEPGTYELTLTLALDAAEGELDPAADGSVDVPVTLRLSSEGDVGDEPEPDALVAHLQPANWNTNWARVGAGWVTVKIVGAGFAEIDLDAIALATSPDGDAAAEALPRERAQRQGNHVRAFFRQADAIGLLEDPIPGATYDLWVLIGEGTALPVSVTVTGPPR